LGRHLAQLCQLQPTFCSDVFPIVVHDILIRHFSGVQARNILSTHFNKFFENHFRFAENSKGKTWSQLNIIVLFITKLKKK